MAAVSAPPIALTDLVRRPGFNTTYGTPSTVSANHFRVTQLPQGRILQWDVDIVPAHNKTARVSQAVKWKVWRHAMTWEAMGGIPVVYNGDKLAWSLSGEVPFEGVSGVVFEVDLSVGGGGPAAVPGTIAAAAPAAPAEGGAAERGGRGGGRGGRGGGRGGRGGRGGGRGGRGGARGGSAAAAASTTTPTPAPAPAAAPTPTPAAPRGDRRDIFRVTLKFATTIEMETLSLFLHHKHSKDSAVLEAINFISHLIRQTPSNTPGLIPIRSSFFTLEGGVKLGDGLDVLSGIYQSARPTFGRMVLNVDAGMSAFLEGHLNVL
ncbi:Protein argonaute [Saitoella coloradoensis]